MITLFNRFTFRPHHRGYFSLTRINPRWEDRWHFGTERAFGLWSISLHCFYLRLDIIGPFHE